MPERLVTTVARTDTHSKTPRTRTAPSAAASNPRGPWTGCIGDSPVPASR